MYLADHARIFTEYNYFKFLSFCGLGVELELNVSYRQNVSNCISKDSSTDYITVTMIDCFAECVSIGLHIDSCCTCQSENK